MNLPNPESRSDASTPGENICLGCGLCSDGTLYSWIRTFPEDDLTPLTRLGAQVVPNPEREGMVFLLPCPAFGQGCCTIYEDRPSRCRSYSCALLKQVEAGEVSTSEALGVIQSALTLRDQVVPELKALVESRPPEPFSDLCERVDAHWDAMADPLAERRKHAGLLFRVNALRTLLTRRFRNPKATPGATQP